MARTNNLSNFLTDVADAIREKKGTSDTILASDFDTEIENLPGGADLSEYFEDTIRAGNSSTPGFMSILKKIPDITNVGNSCSYMFYNFKGTEIDLSSFNTSNVATMDNMFRACANLIKLDVSNFNTENVINMSNMFRGISLLELDLSSFYTPKLTNINEMFIYASNLKKIDMRNFTFDLITTGYSNTFAGVPDDCEIIVKSDTEKAWVLNVRSDLTNVKTVAELEAE